MTDNNQRLDELKELALNTLEEITIYGTFRERIAAAKELLEFTMQKPKITTEVTNVNAEGHLKALMKYGKMDKPTFMDKVKLTQQQKK